MGEYQGAPPAGSEEDALAGDRLYFAIDRDLLAGADILAFVVANIDYWDLVHDCRLGFAPYGRAGA
jgi:hypothetical protein